MKNTFFLSAMVLLAACGNNENKTTTEVVKTDSVVISKADLVKIKWINGNWQGIDGDKPFYEQYEMINDSTIRITSYEWDGKDSSKTGIGFISWQQGAYYLGDSMNYKAIAIDNTRIDMKPNYKANNSVLFTYINDSTWKAVLTGKKTVEYTMQKLPSIEKMRSSAKK